MADNDTALGELPSPITFGKYTLHKRLAIDAHIEAFRAKTEGLGGFERDVSVRRLRAGTDEVETVRTFVEAAKRASALKHANIAPIVDLGKIDGQVYAASDFVDGPTLADLLDPTQTDRRVPVGVACHVIIRVLEGLEYAHNQTDDAGHTLALLHNGVAPQDIAVSKHGQVKLLNFGLSSFHTSPQSAHGVDTARASYMSPEQVRGLPLSRATDTFAVGIILHELLTGQRLFAGASEFETLEKIRKVEVTPPSLLNAAVPAELEDIVLRALAKTARDRFEGAGAMAHALQRFMFQSETYVTDADVAELISGAFPEEDWGPVQAAPHAAASGVAEVFASASGSAPAPPALPELDWDDEEEATSVFARDQSSASFDAPSEAEELGEWSRDLATGVHRPRNTGAQPVVPSAVDEILADSDDGGFEAEATNVRRPESASVSRSVSQSVSSSAPTPVPVAPPGPAEKAQSGALTQPAKSVQEERRGGGIWWVAAAALLGLVVIFLLFGRGADAPDVHIAATPADLQYTVLLNDRVVHEGTPPFVLEGVSPGQHLLTLRAPGHSEYARTITVEEENDLRVDYAMRPLPHIDIPFRTTPAGATVYIGGEAHGDTPTTVSLPIGERVALELRMPGYESHTTSFQVTEQSAAITIAMTVSADTGSPSPDTSAAAGSGDEPPAGSGDALMAEQPGSGDAPSEEVMAADTEQTAQAQEAEAPTPTPAAAPAEEARPAATPRTTPTPTPDTSARAEREAAEREAAEAAAVEQRAAERRAARAERQARERREREAAEAAAAQAEPAPAVGPPGFISVQSQPPATVLIDGENAGQTPLNAIPVTPGRHRVQLLNEAAGVDRTYRVSIDSGESRTIVNRAR